MRRSFARKAKRLRRWMTCASKFARCWFNAESASAWHSWFDETKSRLQIEIRAEAKRRSEAMSEPARPAATPGQTKGHLWVLLAVSAAVVLVPLAALGLLWSGWADGWARRAVVEQVGKMTGGTVDLGSIRLEPLALRVTLHDLTIHGHEPAGTPPFFHADQLEVAVSIDNFWSHKISLRNLEVTRPSMHVRFEKDGSSNCPGTSAAGDGATRHSLRQRLFDLAVRRLRLIDGEMLFNDVRMPLVAEGGRFDLAVDYSDAQWTLPRIWAICAGSRFQVALRRYIPFPQRHIRAVSSRTEFFFRHSIGVELAAYIAGRADESSPISPSLI